jgi:hypothetical protein
MHLDGFRRSEDNMSTVMAEVAGGQTPHMPSKRSVVWTLGPT